MRKGICPVLTERSGSPHRHILVSRRPRCKGCPPDNRLHLSERCHRQHPNYARCNACGFEDREHHFCDSVVGRTLGISTQYGYCDRRTTDQYTFQYRHGELHWKTAGHWWLCKQHSPQAVEARKDAAEARYQEYVAKQDAYFARLRSETEAIKVAAEMARWIAANRELAEEDEWLGKIAHRIAENQTIQERLSREKKS